LLKIVFCVSADVLHHSVANHGLHEDQVAVGQRHCSWKFESAGLSESTIVCRCCCCCRHSWGERKTFANHVQKTCGIVRTIPQFYLATFNDMLPQQFDTQSTPRHQDHLYHPSQSIQRSFSQLQSTACPPSNLSLLECT
jgi:hypothetical protein